MGKAWTPLRIAVMAAGLLGTAFWLGCLVHWWLIPDERRDGLELIGVFLSTTYFIALVLPTLVLGLLGRWLGVAAVFAGLVIALASDTLFPWIPWDLLPGRL
jgi:hypothetical protein